MDSSDWIRKAVLERELADIESKFHKPVREIKTYEEHEKANEEFMKRCHVCEYIRDQLGEMK